MINKLLRMIKSADKRLTDRASQIQQSVYFDANWYREKHGISEKDSPIFHYLQQGSLLDLAPHPLFDVEWYITQNPNISRSDTTPLEHFISASELADATPHPLFDPQWYRSQLQSPLPKGVAPFAHFLSIGGPGGVSPHPAFDPVFYLSQDPLLTDGRTNLLTHFVEWGCRHGRNPNRFFNASWYLQQNKEVNQKRLNPLSHFLGSGARLGLLPCPGADLDIYAFNNPGCPADRLQAYYHMLANAPEIDQLQVTPTDITRDWGSAFNPVQISSSYFGLATDQDDQLPATHKIDIDIDGLKGAKFISCDIWDTVLRRDCHPDEIKLQSARYLLLSAYNNLRPLFRNTASLLATRVQAENNTASNNEFEYRFEDAIVNWLEIVLEVGVARHERQELRKKLLMHELAAEARSTRPDHDILGALSRVEKPTGFASDFYMSRSFIRQLLASHSIDGRFIFGFSSSDTFETKRSGRLFQKMLAELSVEPGDLVHIGDHAVSDCAVPQSLGVQSVHFVNKSEETRRTWFGEALDALRGGNVTPHSRRIAAITNTLADTYRDGTDSGNLRAIGAQLSPIVFGYCLNIMEQALFHGAAGIYFCTREGQLFAQAYNSLKSADPFNVSKYTEATLLEVSRRSTFAASLQDFDTKELMRIWSLYTRQSLSGLFASLNVNSPEIAALASRYDINMDEIIDHPWRDERVRNFIGDPRVRELTRGAISTQTHLLSSYLAQAGIPDKDIIILADIGWRGSIQDNIAKLRPKTFFHGCYLGLFRFLNPQPVNTSKNAFLFNANNEQSTNEIEVSPLEMIFNGPGGSVVGYILQSDGVHPVREVFEGEESVISQEVAVIQEGILGCIPELADYVRLHGLVSSDLRSLAHGLLESLVKSPPAEIADAYARLHHNETFGVGQVDRVGSEIPAILSELRGPRLHAASADWLARSRWKSGALATSSFGKFISEITHEQRLALPASFLDQGSAAIIKSKGSRLAVYAPPPLSSSGGHRTIFNVVRRLAEVGFNPVIFLEGIGAGVEVVEEYLGDTRAAIHTQWHRHIPSDVAIATIAHSASFVAQLDCYHKAYLVQDNEALFNPMSDGYVIAENSYAQGLTHFTIGNWLSHLIGVNYGAKAIPAGLGVDTKVYRRLTTPHMRELAVCFLYQPDKPRRTPVLGIEALRRVYERIPGIKIYVYGSNLPLHLDFPVENLGLIGNLNDLNELYNRCTVGLCISGSNPSRIPYEMMAAGCVPVDLYRYNNLMDHEANSALLAYQDAVSIAEAILSILASPERAISMSQSAENFVRSRTLDWETDVIANGIISMLKGRATPVSPVEMTYGESPFVAPSSRSKSVERFCAYQRYLATQDVPYGLLTPQSDQNEFC